MSKFYYFNKNTDDKGRHEVHLEECIRIPDIKNREFIGYEPNCKSAIERINKKYPYKSFDGCFYCCKECHKG